MTIRDKWIYDDIDWPRLRWLWFEWTDQEGRGRANNRRVMPLTSSCSEQALLL
jgi:hypothetical protein